MSNEQPQKTMMLRTNSIDSEAIDSFLFRERITPDKDHVVAKFRLFALAGRMTSQGWNKPTMADDDSKKEKERECIPAGYLANLFFAKEFKFDYPQAVKQQEKDPKPTTQVNINLATEILDIIREFGTANKLSVDAAQNLLIEGLPKDHKYKIPKIDHPVKFYFSAKDTPKKKVVLTINSALYKSLFIEAGKRQSVAKIDILNGMGPHGKGWSMTQVMIDKMSKSLELDIDYGSRVTTDVGALIELMINIPRSFKIKIHEGAKALGIPEIKFALKIIHKHLDIAEAAAEKEDALMAAALDPDAIRDKASQGAQEVAIKTIVEAEKSKASQSAQDQINIDSISQRKPKPII